MDNPYFSIIVPMYNAERYIKICIDSILNQTFQDFEVIIVDDVSTDNSCKICSELYGTNEKIRLIRQDKNQGPGTARNLGIKVARGEYIFFVDSDDVIVPDAFEKLHKALKAESDVDVVHIKGWYQTAQVDDKPLDFRRIIPFLEENPNVGFLKSDIRQRLLENWLTNRLTSFGWLYVYRRAFLEEYDIKFPIENIYSEDHPFLIAGMCFAKKYLMLRAAFTVYRVRDESLSHNKNISYGIKSLSVLIKSYKNILDRVPQLKDERIFKEQCIQKSLDNALKIHARSFYSGLNIDKKLDTEVYETMLPIFGENTTLVKYLFHGFNVMCQQANSLSQQLHSLQKRETVYQKQEKLIEQLKKLLDQYER